MSGLANCPGEPASVPAPCAARPSARPPTERPASKLVIRMSRLSAVSTAAAIKVTEVSGSTTALVSTTGTILAGKHHTVLLSDNGQSSTGYIVTILEDQQTAAASGHSAFRFINMAPSTGAVDVYMVPSGSTLAESKALVSNIAAGAVTDYTSFSSQTVTMEVTAYGSTTALCTQSLALTGGEVRTVLLVNTQLTSSPAIEAFVAKDVN